MGRKKNPYESSSKSTESPKHQGDRSASLPRQSDVWRYERDFSSSGKASRHRREWGVRDEPLEHQLQRMMLGIRERKLGERQTELDAERRKLGERQTELDKEDERLSKEGNRLDKEDERLKKKEMRQQELARIYELRQTELEKRVKRLNTQFDVIKDEDFFSTNNSVYNSLPDELKALVSQRERIKFNETALTHLNSIPQEIPLDRYGNPDMLGHYNNVGHYSNATNQFSYEAGRIEIELEGERRSYSMNLNKQWEQFDDRRSKYEGDYTQCLKDIKRENAKVGTYNIDRDKFERDNQQFWEAKERYDSMETQYARDVEAYNRRARSYEQDRKNYEDDTNE